MKGKEYRLLFTLNALDELQTRFGGYDELDKVFDESNKEWVKDTKWLLTLLVNEGILEEDEDAKLFTEQQIGRMIHLGNMKEVQKAIYASFAAGVAGGGGGDDEEENIEEKGETKAVQEI